MATLTTLAPAALAAHPHGWHGGGGWWFFPLFPLLFFGFWFFVIFFVIRPLVWRRRGFVGPMGYCGPGGTAYGWHPNSGAEGVLAERFARGEIDETEYRARLEVLRVRR